MYSLTTDSKPFDLSSYICPTPPPHVAKRSAISLEALVARSQSDRKDVPTASGYSNGANSRDEAVAPEARTLTRQRPIAPERLTQSFSTSFISGGRNTLKLLLRCGVRSNTKPLLSADRVRGSEASSDTISRLSNSISPSLKVRTILPTPPVPWSGG